MSKTKIPDKKTREYALRAFGVELKTPCLTPDEIELLEQIKEEGLKLKRDSGLRYDKPIDRKDLLEEGTIDEEFSELCSERLT
jgi:hypothetical protein